MADNHREWVDSLIRRYGYFSDEEQAWAMLQQEVGKKFVKALEDAGVMKDEASFLRLINALNQ